MQHINKLCVIIMIEELYFNSDEQVKISAASVGISKRRWICISSKESVSGQHKIRMQKERIDVLPIVEENGLIKEFFLTEKPNVYSSIKRHRIKFENTLPLDTDIAIVISKLNDEKKRYYFLTRQKEVVGLITIGNLNCKQVQIYIFNILCELETLLSDFINMHLSQKQIIEWLEKKSNSNKKYTEIIEAYNSLVKSDLENMITEHLYFTDLFSVIKDTGLAENLGFSKNKWSDFNGINEVRNKIAHPTRSLLDSKNNITDLNRRLGKINELIFCLKNFKSETPITKPKLH